ncbi:hypothetical protein PEC18_34170 [Paucibacter sp. O1-1]|nr:hypothetical protein [Paucibacter sp. O1-1]MDA3830737.1 hypothetical protein [Paucibacter sp. O1-1]
MKKKSQNPASRLALAMFCYSVKKAIGQFAAVLNGLDGLVFTGGIGENVPQIRQRICDEMDYLGILLDENLNAKHPAETISSEHSKVSRSV